ncbi:MAG: pantoate--beta-alanine ligase [Candidatus Kapabacteria bacterium]|nr:pantoate--beta-alanine ligase [Candidatus Kapabacteria bacterium]
MQIIHTVSEMQAFARSVRASGQTLGCVPTMGALHAGHASLVREAAAHHEHVVTSVFVNPTQFGPNEDFSRYPRTLDSDIDVVRAHGGTVVFAPPVDEMYPSGTTTMIHVGGVTAPYEGALRPGHFDGVATIVCKLLQAILPDEAYFGQKDYQQTLVIKQLVHDLLLPVRVTVCPTVREADGLAMSSRNIYLSAEDRQRASTIYRALRTGQALAHTGETRRVAYEQLMRDDISTLHDVTIDYLEAARAADLSTPDAFEHGEEIVLLAAVRMGTTRLIDNLLACVGGETA